MTSVAQSQRDYDFALLLTGVSELTSDVETALFESGCDDATLSMQHGVLCLDFHRRAVCFKDAILSAIRDVQRAKLAGQLWRVDDCPLVSPAEIARRMGKTRQLVHQYITGERGPGGFPPPEYNLTQGQPVWSWYAVSRWLCQNQFLPPETQDDAEVVATINTALELAQQRQRNPQLVHELKQIVAC